MSLPRFAHLAVSAGLLLSCAIGFAAAQQQEDSRPTVRLKHNRADAIVEFQRPLNGGERADLVRSGLRIYRAVGGSRYLVRLSETTMATLQSHPLFVGMEPVDPADKMSASIAAGTPAPHATDADGTVRVVVQFYPDVDFGQANATLRRHGLKPAEGKTTFDLGSRLEASGRAQQVRALAESSLVQYVQEVSPPGKLHNATAGQLSNVDDVQAAPYNLTGNGVNVGLWDGGPVRTTHQDFGGRVTQVEGGSDSAAAQDHGTHVSGTIAGSGGGNAAAIGMATQANVWAHRFNSGDPTTEQQNAFDSAMEAIRMANHSWGPILGWDTGPPPSQTGNNNLFGAYEGNAVAWDTLVRNRTQLVVVNSSGNDDGDCDPDPNNPPSCDGVNVGGQFYDLLGTFKNAKNVITVGAVNDDGTTKANFSSTGPSDDGRIKPDIVANGVTLTSTCSASDMDYCSKGGTSMATPTVTGTVAVLTQHYLQRYGVTATPSADIMKALLTNTAADIGRPGPDYQFGFGRLDALAAAQTIDAGPVRILTGAVDNGDTDEFLVPVPAGTPSLRVTLNWLDPPGAASTTDDEGTSDVINNLDLVLVAPNNASFFPFTGPGRGNETANATATGANNVDTVEQAVVANPQQGFWKVRVRGTGVPSGPQNYALVSNVSFSLPDQPEIEVNAPLAFDERCVGDFEDRTVSIFNTGGGILQVSSVTVSGSPAFSIQATSPSAPLLIQPGAHVDYTIRFSPGAQAQAYAGTLTIVSDDADEGSIQIAITGASGAPSIDTTIADSGSFGDVCRGSFKDLELTVINSGTCPLNVTNITASAAEFIVPGTVALPVTVGAGDALALPVRYQPTDLGADAGTFTITSNAENAPSRNVNVSGNAPPGDVRVTGSTDFGNVCAEELAEKPLSVCNVGKCDLAVVSVAFDPPCADFTLINNPFPAAVSPDSCQDVVIRFTPTSAGPKSCTLVITTDDPDTPVIQKTVTANTPLASIDVPPDMGFLPEVIQSAGTCTTGQPFPVSNTGLCPLTITAFGVTANPEEFSLLGLPSFPIILDPGHIAGDGDLDVVFGPHNLDRDRNGTIEVTYVSDAITGDTATETREVCGEGVLTGARVLVTAGGIPLAQVEQIKITRINANRNRNQLDTVDTARNLALTTVTPAAPCAPFQYHREYGTVSNPIQLLPGSFQVTATAIVNGKRVKKTVGFDVTTCDFNPTIVVAF
jgi:subtilisin family serine protease